MARQPYPILRSLKERFAEAGRKLTAAGYEHIASVMTDGNVGTDYGQVFVHTRARKFYLNSETLSQVDALYTVHRARCERCRTAMRRERMCPTGQDLTRS
jgi:hypothetical protein